MKSLAQSKWLNKSYVFVLPVRVGMLYAALRGNIFTPRVSARLFFVKQNGCDAVKDKKN